MKEDFINAMNFRHACKIFNENKKISKEDFEYILEIGRLSPSSFGFEPWKFLVVQNIDLREKLKENTWGAQGSLLTCSHFVIILARKENSMRYDSSYLKHIMTDIKSLTPDAIEKRTNMVQGFQENDFSLLNTEGGIFAWSCRQTYIALANMMSGASMIGIDSCPIEGFKMNEIEQLLQEDFNIDKNEFGASVMVAFGYRVNEQLEKTRQKIQDITKWYE